MSFALDGKVAVVTGAASGIGRAVAERLADAGATVMLADLSDASALATELGGAYLRTDVSDEGDVAALMASAAELGQSIDIVVNNAGIVVAETPIVETDAEDLLRAFSVNALGVFFGLKHAPLRMTGGGAIVNTASLAGRIGFPAYCAYAASKAAVISLTQTAAVELGPEGIRVNAICPSSVDTPMLAAQESGEIEAALSAAAAPLGRIADPAHAAALIHFLVADDCPVVSGQAVNLDGGLSAGFSIGLIEAVGATL
jgi:NAD(P)-dependent dehydrogenase (short-subunit alcohol dehydrogenase family)